MAMTPIFLVVTLIAVVCITHNCGCDALQMPGSATVSSSPQPQYQQHQLSRRDAMMTSFGVVVASAAAVMVVPQIASADESDAVLTEEEMAARVARKLELQRKARGGGSSSTTTTTRAAATIDAGIPSSAYTADIRSDVNPEAGTDLRSRSFLENTKIAIEKQEEMAKRDKKQKREDLCEMLGRGC